MTEEQLYKKLGLQDDGCIQFGIDKLADYKKEVAFVLTSYLQQRDEKETQIRQEAQVRISEVESRKCENCKYSTTAEDLPENYSRCTHPIMCQFYMPYDFGCNKWEAKG